MHPSERDGAGQPAAVSPSPKAGRRQPNWQEQQKRLAWGRFWGPTLRRIGDDLRTERG